NGGAVLDPQLVNKSVDIGWETPDPIVISHDAGHDALPVKFFYNHLRRNVWEIVVPADSPIKTLKDLKGARIGVNSMATTNIPTTESMLRSVGLDPKKDVSFIAVGMGGPAFQAIRTKQIDALNLFDTMHTLLEQSGFAIRRLDLGARYTGLLQNGFVTHVDNLKAKRRALVGFSRAIAKATVGCYANLPACVHIAWKEDPKTKPANLSDEAALAGAVAVLKTRGVSYFDFPKGEPRRWGSYSDAMWQNTISVLHETGVIHSDKIDPKTLYTNDLIADINAFDSKAVEQQAEALK
ncbi:MAG TPA: ABC transporter substrate-binding protein, partial [Stellaceae bacterium]|nr:ABC transporter substrate-binding protein [Stellaceae bacterium]